ncbi:MAG TPA: PRC-barrel domain-containing protein [Xanthobacteraceae bacterium]|nr:PRC-barrel domain-containing protein [Xanthobacteraceae bacterium]
MIRKIATYTTLAAIAFTPAVAFAQSAPNPVSPPPAATDPAMPMPAEKMPSTTNAVPTVVPATPKFVQQQSSGQWLGSDLIGTDVVTATDEALGEISDVVMEKDGRVVAAIIDVGGFLGIGAKPVAVSFETLTVAPTANGSKIVVALSKEELNQAPAFKTLDQQRTATQ